MATAKKLAAKKSAAKTAVKSAPGKKPVISKLAGRKPVVRKPSPTAKLAVAPAAAKSVGAKAPKIKKIKPVRDSFTMPKSEYAALDTLKLRAASLAAAVKKSELLRAGVKALTAMSDRNFLAAVKAVPTIKTGRPPAR